MSEDISRHIFDTLRLVKATIKERNLGWPHLRNIIICTKRNVSLLERGSLCQGWPLKGVPLYSLQDISRCPQTFRVTL